jgi:hypothetical protein
MRNIPYKEDEKTKEIIQKIAKAKNIQLMPTEYTCFRATSKTPPTDITTPPIIIIQFKTTAKKNELKKQDTPLTLDTITDKEEDKRKKIYINENLPKHTRRLYYLTRQFRSKYNYKYAWTKDGHVFVRHTDTSKTIEIMTETDITRLEQQTQP